MGELNFFSTLQDLDAASDEQILREMGAVSPEIVIEYVLHLRRKTNVISKEDNARPPAYNPEYRDDLPGSSRESREVTGLKVIEGEASLKGAVASRTPDIQQDIHGNELSNLKDFVLDKKLRVGDKIIAEGFLNARCEFSINLRTNDLRTAYQITFSDTGEMVMSGTGSWTSISDSVEQRNPGQKYKLVIMFDTKEIRMFIDYIEKKSFPYLTPLEELTAIWCQPRWIWGSVTVQQGVSSKVGAALDWNTQPRNFASRVTHSPEYVYVPTRRPHLTPPFKKIKEKYKLQRKLKDKDKICLMGKYNPEWGSWKFYVKFNRGYTCSSGDFTADLHIALEPDNILRMKSDNHKDTDITIKHKPFLNEPFLLEIVCGSDGFQVYLNEVSVGLFPYLNELFNIFEINLAHGSKGNGWFWLSLPQGQYHR
eukprot:sb/3464989/